MPLKALLFDCDGEIRGDTWKGPCNCDPASYLMQAWSAHCSQHQGCVAGVILLSEELHRVAYNAAFENFDVRPNGEDEVANW